MGYLFVSIKPELLFLFGFILVGCLLLYVVLKSENATKEKGQKLAEVAGSLGFSLQPEEDFEKYREFTSFIHLNRREKDLWLVKDPSGNSPPKPVGPVYADFIKDKIYNYMEGDREGYHWKIFDHRVYREYVTGKTKGANHETIYHTKLREVTLPAFRLGDKSLKISWDKILLPGELDIGNIKFDDNPKFSKRYWVKGEQEEDIRWLFNDEVISYFENNKTIYYIESTGSEVIFISGKSSAETWLEPEVYPEKITEYASIIKLFKQSLQS